MSILILNFCVGLLIFRTFMLRKALINQGAEISRLLDQNHKLLTKIHKLEKED